MRSGLTVVSGWSDALQNSLACQEICDTRRRENGGESYSPQRRKKTGIGGFTDAITKKR